MQMERSYCSVQEAVFSSLVQEDLIWCFNRRILDWSVCCKTQVSQKDISRRILNFTVCCRIWIPMT